MRVSFTDQWQTLFDENGKPLVGRVKFMKADASQYKPVYYENNGEQALAPNPCYTLQDGRLEYQIFLDYGVYTCIVEKFIGVDSSNMTDYADDSDYWQELKRFKIYGGEEKSSGMTDIESGFVDTIADLRLVNPTEHSIVTVAGYYTKTDGIEPRTYVWEEGSSFSEDFGSTIISSLSSFTNSGAWKLCETPILCGTTFGVFPNMSSTITASDLTTKATALCNYANISYCCKVMLKAGHYYFAEGARLSFNKIVTTDAAANKTIKFDMDGIQDLQEGETLSGTVEISFMRGLDYKYSNILSDNAEYITFIFGSFTEIKASWISYKLKNHIDRSSVSDHVRMILNVESTADFCSNNKTFNNWEFVGNDLAHQVNVGDNVTFNNCKFNGKCFNSVGENCTFLECGDIYQESIMNSTTYLRDTCIYNSNGSVKSYGTRFLANKYRITRTYSVALNNDIVVPFGDEPKIVSPYFNILKYFDKTWTLQGKIYFSNSVEIYASSYTSFSDCVYCSLQSGFPVNLEQGSFSYTISTTGETSPRLFKFKNGTLTLGKSGRDVKDSLILESLNVILSTDIDDVSISATDCNFNENTKSLGTSSYTVDLYLKNCFVSTSIVYAKALEATRTSFLCSLNLYPTNGILRQRLVGCVFTEQVLICADTYNTIACCIINGSTFEFNNGGTPVSAIATYAGGQASFAEDRFQRYNFDGNNYVGDAYLLPTKKAIFKLTSSTNSTPPSSAFVGLVSSGSITEAFDYIGNLVKIGVDNWLTSNFFEATLFHIGQLTYKAKAKPITRTSKYNYGQGDHLYMLPMTDFVYGTTLTQSDATYMIYGDNPTGSDRTAILNAALPQIEWILEIEKYNPYV